MDRSFWLDRWSRGQIAFHQAHVNPYLEPWWPRVAAPAGSSVFVPLCGKSLDMRWLYMQGHPVIGIELAREALGDFFAATELVPRITRQPPLERWDARGFTLFCGDFFDLTAETLQKVSAVFDRASLIALPGPTRPRYVQHMRAILPNSTVTLLVSVTYPQEEMQGPPFSVDEREIRELYSHTFDVEKLASYDVLHENQRFRERGLTQMSEQVYLIRWRLP
jgi:thiopurine S-methyltransferase